MKSSSEKQNDKRVLDEFYKAERRLTEIQRKIADAEKKALIAETRAILTKEKK